ncbi:hypothetical protein, partial [Lactobacillus gallinarum]|uniref:hypothetical protein n=1 Tax=Lactobacillus gallinarum TaxID=52242 RepID=UPI0019D2972B
MDEKAKLLIHFEYCFSDIGCNADVFICFHNFLASTFGLRNSFSSFGEPSSVIFIFPPPRYLHFIRS